MRKNAGETGDVILQVALTFDHDAISADVGEGSRVFERSIGEFGPRVGLPRILALLAQETIPATFFIPVHTARTWPGDLARSEEHTSELQSH